MGSSKSAGGLGFRDLSMFNKSLLAKQCWGLIQNPHSVISQIMKAKYFPNTYFLASVLGKRPSFIWRSFMAAKDLLSCGLIWRIGDGNSINIWGDRWLPNIGPLNFSPDSGLSCDAKMLELIDVSVKGWKCLLIDSSFPVHVANMIKKSLCAPHYLRAKLFGMILLMVCFLLEMLIIWAGIC